MKNLISVVLLCCALVVPVAALEPDTMNVGPMSLKIGATSHEVRSALPSELKFSWERSAPSTESRQTAVVATQDQASSPVVVLEFDRDKLSRATRLIGTEDLMLAPASELIGEIVSTLSAWASTSDSPIRATASQLQNDEQRLDEVVFRQGDRSLVLVRTDNSGYLVENLGRGDTPVVTSTP